MRPTLRKTSAFLGLLALALAAHTQGPPAAKPKRRPPRVYDGAKKPTPEEIAWTNRNSAESARYRKAYGDGDLDAALRIARRLTLLEPEDEGYACALADVLFRRGDADGAYAAVTPFLRSGAQEMTLLRVALAAALRGESRPGVEPYLRRVLERAFPRSQLESALPPEGAPGATRLLALLALGVTSNDDTGHYALSRFYYERALAADPTNPIASICLGGLAQQRKEWGVALGYYRTALLRGDANTRSACERLIRLANEVLAQEKARRDAPASPP